MSQSQQEIVWRERVSAVRPATHRHDRERVRLVLTYIAGRIGSATHPLSLDELAAVALTAPAHFHRIFRHVIGEPPYHFVRRLRLEYSAYRLLYSRRPIFDLALEAGYQSHAGFTRAFKQAFECQPVEFRRGACRADLRRTTQRDAMRTRSLAAVTVACLRHVGPYREVRSTWRRLARWLLARRAWPASLQAIGISHDGPETCLDGTGRYDACVVVPNEFDPADGIEVRLIPAMQTVTAVHKGPHDLLVCTYVHIAVEWARSTGGLLPHRVPWYERYHEFPHLGDDPEVRADIDIRLN
jgi:AraC family transcriptional regulator